MKSLLLSIACTGLLLANSHAVITGIDSVTQSGGSSPVANDAILSGFVASGTSYSGVTAATASGETSTVVFVGDNSALYPDPPGTSFPTGNASYTDLNLTTGVNGTSSGDLVKFQFSGLTASSIVYMFDFASTDASIFKLVDGTGTIIPGDFRLTVVDADWGQPMQVDVRTSSTDFGNLNINGVIFSIGDFQATQNSGGISIGDFYSGTNATGFSIGSSGGLDVIEVGLASPIPEPTAAVLMLSATGLLALRRRRSRGR